MSTLHFEKDKNFGGFKVANATNGGPWHRRFASDSSRSNFKAYKEARIPYARNHDSALLNIYGGPYAHDISSIFPRFEADVNNPESYDFACTDESILTCLDAGTETFFRLGQSIEHQVKKHATLPPADFQKWAEICEHIIRHYNEGWADGFQLNIKYWEIWAEPDCDPEDSDNKRCWGGTKNQFFDLFETAAKHLKSCFPQYKIGGPALSHDEEWAKDFLQEMHRRNVPLDFFSWHIYTNDPQNIMDMGMRIQVLLDINGYGSAENINDEYNYLRSFDNGFTDSIEQIIKHKGAAFTMACMSAMQESPIDMMMYYDTRQCIFCGVFDFYTGKILKGYYPFLWYADIAESVGKYVAANDAKNVYHLFGYDKDDKIHGTLTYFTDDENAKNMEIELDFAKSGKYEIRCVDENHSGNLINIVDCLRFVMRPNSILRIDEV